MLAIFFNTYAIAIEKYNGSVANAAACTYSLFTTALDLNAKGLKELANQNSDSAIKLASVWDRNPEYAKWIDYWTSLPEDPKLKQNVSSEGCKSLGMPPPKN